MRDQAADHLALASSAVEALRILLLRGRLDRPEDLREAERLYAALRQYRALASEVRAASDAEIRALDPRGRTE